MTAPAYTAAALLAWFGPDASARTIANQTGVTTRTVTRWRANPHTTLTLNLADHIATRLHEHLDTIWTPEATAA